MTDQIPPSLMRFGAEFEKVSRRELASASRRARRRTLRLAAASATTLAAIIAAVVLVVGATTGTAPAYALTQNADGVTISLNDLTTGIPALNARLKQMGINYTVIPVTPSCSTSTPVLGAAPGSLSETITIGTKNTEPAGVDGYLAAEQLPNGQIGLGIGGMKAPLPTCFSPTLMKTHPSSTPNPSSATVTSSTTSSLPLPVPAAVRRQLNAAKAHGTGTATTTTTAAASPPPGVSYATTTTTAVSSPSR